METYKTASSKRFCLRQDTRQAASYYSSFI